MKSHPHNQAFVLTKEQSLFVSGGNGHGVEPEKGKDTNATDKAESLSAITLRALNVTPAGNGSGNEPTNP